MFCRPVITRAVICKVPGKKSFTHKPRIKKQGAGNTKCYENKNIARQLNMKAYMVFSRNAGSMEAACLVFAHKATEARKLGFYLGWWDDWTDIATRWIRDNAQIFREADQKKIKQGIAHVIESPETCNCCGFWGNFMNDKNICDDCHES